MPELVFSHGSNCPTATMLQSWYFQPICQAPDPLIVLLHQEGLQGSEYRIAGHTLPSPHLRNVKKDGPTLSGVNPDSSHIHAACHTPSECPFPAQRSGLPHRQDMREQAPGREPHSGTKTMHAFRSKNSNPQFPLWPGAPPTAPLDSRGHIHKPSQRHPRTSGLLTGWVSWAKALGISRAPFAHLLPGIVAEMK